MDESWPGRAGKVGSAAISFARHPIQALWVLERALWEVRGKLRLDRADRCRFVFREEVAGAHQLACLLPRQREIARARAIAARELLGREGPPAGVIAAGF